MCILKNNGKAHLLKLIYEIAVGEVLCCLTSGWEKYLLLDGLL